MRRPFAALRTAALASGSALSLVLAASLPLAMANPALAQAQPVRALDSSVGGFNLASVNALLAKGDAAAAAGNYSQARKDYDEAREACRRLIGFYRDLSGAFRGLDARIPRELDQKGREALEAQAQASLRLAALFRRQNQPEVAVPLLVEVVKIMTPAREEGRKAYQSLVELGFVTTPYNAAGPTLN